MHQFRRPFGKLHWRLALSYVLVTLVVALIIEIVNIAATIASEQASQKSNQSSYFAKLVAELIAPQLQPYLEQNPPDQQGLTTWITTLMYPANNSQGNSTPAKPTGCCSESKFALVVVLNAAGKTLVSASSIGAPNPDDLTTPQAQQVIRAALDGDQTPADQIRILPDGRAVIAVPVLSPEDQRVLGVLFLIPVRQVLTAINKPSSAPSIILTALNPNAFYFIVLACIVVTLAGLLASRGITRRLRLITYAVHAWSQGELYVEIADRSRDEVGQLARDLNNMAEQLQHLLTTRQELAVVQERHRMARDLHNSVKQQMFVLTMLVGAARALVQDHPQAEQTLGEAERVAGQTQQELHALIRALRPVALAGKGLSAALQEVICGWSRSTGIAAQTDLPAALSLPLEAEQALFRVAQEALNNVARHSGATAIEACLIQEAERVLLTIQDNGHGFHVAQPDGQGVGLGSMRERVEALGGTLLIFSTSTGTRVEAGVPIPSA